MYIILRSEETGFPITRTCPTSRQGDLIFLDAFWFSWFDFRRQKPTPDRSNRDVWVCVCVRWNVRFSVRFARSVLPKIIPTIYQLYEFFFFFFLVILFCGVHISNLFAIILSFICLRLGNLKLMLLRSFFLFASRIFFRFVSMPLCLCVNPSNYFSVYRFWETKLVMFIIFV